MKSAGKAAAWSAVGSWAGLAGSMVSLVILARLLDPTDFDPRSLQLGLRPFTIFCARLLHRRCMRFAIP